MYGATCLPELKLKAPYLLMDVRTPKHLLRVGVQALAKNRERLPLLDHCLLPVQRPLHLTLPGYATIAETINFGKYLEPDGCKTTSKSPIGY